MDITRYLSTIDFAKIKVSISSSHLAINFWQQDCPGSFEQILRVANPEFL